MKQVLQTPDAARRATRASASPSDAIVTSPRHPGFAGMVPHAPALMTVAVFLARTGLSRASLYRNLARGNFRGVKLGKRLLIDADHAFAFLGSLPKAEFRPLPKAA